MFDQFDALEALASEGTTSAAAAKLRVSQSTISKRIAALEAQLGHAVHERVGRECRLNAYGRHLLERAGPLLAELRAVLATRPEARAHPISVACSESILSSWGAEVFAVLRDRVTELSFDFHAHRSPLAVERVRSGRCQAALVAGEGRKDPELEVETLGYEEMLVVPASLDRSKLRSRRAPLRIDAWTIEEASATWKSIRTRIAAMRESGLVDLRIAGRLGSFASLVQFARAGLGHALVPRGIALAMGIQARQLFRMRQKDASKTPQLRRRIAWVTRKRAARLERMQKLEAELGPVVARLLSRSEAKKG